jgi:hypothetical protein
MAGLFLTQYRLSQRACAASCIPVTTKLPEIWKRGTEASRSL